MEVQPLNLTWACLLDILNPYAASIKLPSCYTVCYKYFLYNVMQYLLSVGFEV